MVNDGLKLLKVHLDASITRYKDQILSGTIPSLAVAAAVSGGSPGANSGRQIIAHGCYGRIGDKPLSLLDHIRMTAYHAGRTISHYRNLVFL